MQTPGPAMVWSASELFLAKFEKLADVSSWSVKEHHGAPPAAPGAPSLSAIAVTVSTSGYAAGTNVEKSPELFPAATTYVTPDATDRQIAMCSGSLFVLPQFPSLEPPPPRLML